MPERYSIGVGFGAVAADTLLPFRDVLHLIYKNVVVLTIYQAGIYISFKVIAVLNILEHPFLLVYIDDIRIWLAAVGVTSLPSSTRRCACASNRPRRHVPSRAHGASPPR